MVVVAGKRAGCIAEGAEVCAGEISLSSLLSFLSLSFPPFPCAGPARAMPYVACATIRRAFSATFLQPDCRACLPREQRRQAYVAVRGYAAARISPFVMAARCCTAAHTVRQA